MIYPTNMNPHSRALRAQSERVRVFAPPIVEAHVLDTAADEIDRLTALLAIHRVHLRKWMDGFTGRGAYPYSETQSLLEEKI